MRLLRSCTPSKSAGNGKHWGALARSSAYTNGGSQSRLLASRDQPVQFSLKLDWRGLKCLPARVDDHVPLRTELRQTQADRFPNPALGPIPLYRLAECSGNCKADPHAFVRLPRQAECGEVRSWHPQTAVVDCAEISRFQDANAFRESVANRRTGRLSRRSR